MAQRRAAPLPFASIVISVHHPNHHAPQASDHHQHRSGTGKRDLRSVLLPDPRCRPGAWQGLDPHRDEVERDHQQAHQPLAGRELRRRRCHRAPVGTGSTGGVLILQGGTTAPLYLLQYQRQPQRTDDRDPDPPLQQGKEPPGKPDGRQPPGDRGAA